MIIDLTANIDHTYSKWIENKYVVDITISSNQICDPSQSSISKLKSKTEFLWTNDFDNSDQWNEFSNPDVAQIQSTVFK